jgi:hypothetical protein
MSRPEIEILLEQEAYQPGELLAGAFGIEADPDDELTTLELSMLWHTSGKGDEDMGVIHFEEWSAVQGKPFDCSQPHSFGVRLPRTPLSYDGFLIKIHWCVRARARWARRRETLREVPFLLGSVAPPQGAKK